MRWVSKYTPLVFTHTHTHMVIFVCLPTFIKICICMCKQHTCVHSMCYTYRYLQICCRMFAISKREIIFHTYTHTHKPIGFAFHFFTLCLVFRKQEKKRTNMKWNHHDCNCFSTKLETTRRGMQKKDEANWYLDQQLKHKIRSSWLQPRIPKGLTLASCSLPLSVPIARLLLCSQEFRTHNAANWLKCK